MITFDELAAMNERLDADRMKWKRRALDAEESLVEWQHRALATESALVEVARMLTDERETVAMADLEIRNLRGQIERTQ